MKTLSLMPLDHLNFLYDLKGDSSLTSLRFHYGLDDLIVDFEVLAAITKRAEKGLDTQVASRLLSWASLDVQIKYLMKIALQEHCPDVHEKLRSHVWVERSAPVPMGLRMKALYLDIQHALAIDDARKELLGNLIHDLLRSQDYALSPQSGYDDERFYEVEPVNRRSSLPLDDQTDRVLMRGISAGLWDAALFYGKI